MAEDILDLFNAAAGRVQGSGQQLSSGLGDLQSGLGNQIASQAAGYAPSQALQQVAMVPQASAQRAQQAALERSNLIAQALQAQGPVAQSSSDILAQLAQQQQQMQLQGEDQIANMRRSAAMSSAAADRNIGRARENKSAAARGSGLEGLTPYQLFGVKEQANQLRSKLLESYATGRRGGKFYQTQINELGEEEAVPVSGRQYVQDLATHFEPLFNTYGLDRKDVLSMIRQAGKRMDESSALTPEPITTTAEDDTSLGASIMQGAGLGAGAGIAGRIGANQLGQRVPAAARVGSYLGAAPKTPGMAAAGAVLAPTFTSDSAMSPEQLEIEADERQRRRAEMTILQRLADSLGIG